MEGGFYLLVSEGFLLTDVRGKMAVLVRINSKSVVIGSHIMLSFLI